MTDDEKMLREHLVHLRDGVVRARLARWLDASLRSAREEGRREGFERARDGSIDALRDTWQALAHGSPEYMAGLSDMLNHGTDAIRAMRDGAGDRQTPAQGCAELCDFEPCRKAGRCDG